MPELDYIKGMEGAHGSDEPATPEKIAKIAELIPFAILLGDEPEPIYKNKGVASAVLGDALIEQYRPGKVAAAMIQTRSERGAFAKSLSYLSTVSSMRFVADMSIATQGANSVLSDRGAFGIYDFLTTELSARGLMEPTSETIKWGSEAFEEPNLFVDIGRVAGLHIGPNGLWTAQGAGSFIIDEQAAMAAHNGVFEVSGVVDDKAPVS